MWTRWEILSASYINLLLAFRGVLLTDSSSLFVSFVLLPTLSVKTCDQEIKDLTLSWVLCHGNIGQVIHTCIPLSLSSVICDCLGLDQYWYWYPLDVL